MKRKVKDRIAAVVWILVGITGIVFAFMNSILAGILASIVVALVIVIVWFLSGFKGWSA